MFLSAVATQRVCLISSGVETWKQSKVTFPCSLAVSAVIECLHLVDTLDGALPQNAPHIQPPDGPVVAALSSWTDCLLCSNLSEFQWTLAFTESQNGIPNFESFYTMNSKSRAKNLFHFLWQTVLYMAANEKLCHFQNEIHKSLSFVCVCVCVCVCIYVYVCAQLCPTLCNPLDYGPLGFLCPWDIFQARILEWLAIPFFRGSYQTHLSSSSCIAGGFFTCRAIREALCIYESESESEVVQLCPTLCNPWTVAH